jgi:hypothetical protein
VGLPEAAGALRAPASADRLVGKRHFRRRTGLPDGRRDLC